MKLQDQVISLDQAKRLKELGISQEGLFYHYVAPHDNGCDAYWETNEIAYNPWFVNASNPEDESDGCTYYVDGTEQYSAFTVAEMGAMLPKTVKLADVQFRYGVMGDCHVQYIIEASESNRILLHKGHQVWTTGKTEAEARAEMLVYLLKNKLITVEEVNARLCQ